MGNGYNFRDETATPAPKGAGKKTLQAIRVIKGTAGGHIASHEFAPNPGGPSVPDEPHPFGASEGPKLLAHLSKHLGIKAPTAGAGAAPPIPAVKPPNALGQ